MQPRETELLKNKRIKDKTQEIPVFRELGEFEMLQAKPQRRQNHKEATWILIIKVKASQDLLGIEAGYGSSKRHPDKYQIFQPKCPPTPAATSPAISHVP